MKTGKTLFFVLVTLIFASCAKEISTEQVAVSANEHKFFDAGKVSDPRLIGLMENLREKERAVPFVDKLMNNVGFPRWDKALRSNSGSSNLLNSAGDSTYVIPIVDSSNKYIVGALVIHMAAVPTFEVRLLDDYLVYEQYKEDFIKAMIWLDYKTFGYKSYEIKDSTLFYGHKGIELRGMPGNTGGDPCDIIQYWYNYSNGTTAYSGYWHYAGDCPLAQMPLITVITGGTAGGSGSYTLPDLTGFITGVVVAPPYTPYPFSLIQTVDYLNEQLQLTIEQKEWLMEHEIRAREMFEYLYGHYTPERASINKEHLNSMMTKPEYAVYVENHRNSYQGSYIMWWENDPFIQNPGFFPFPTTPIGWIPYHCNYQLTQHEQDVFDQLDAEDQLNANQNLDCKGTKRTGNINFQGTKEHLLIQMHYVIANPLSGEVEFKIPNASITNPANPGYADIVNLGYGNIFEIKPNNQAGTQAGVLEVDNYVAKANINCSGTLAAGVWNKSGSYSPIYLPTSVSGRFLKAELTAPGVIGYSYVNNFTPPTPVPVVVPSSVLDKIKHLIERLKNNLTDADRIIAEYLRENPELVTYIQSAAIGVATAIIVGTILEDVATAGAGVWNDWVSFTLSYRIIRFAIAL